MKKKNQAIILFYLLVIYMLFQFTWWSYLIYGLNKEIIQLKKDIVQLSYQDQSRVDSLQKELQQKLDKKVWMIAGEGSVFLIIMVAGIFRTLRSIKKEQQLVRQQNNFLLSITHELKTPIASTRLQLETLLKRDLDKSKQNEILSRALFDTDRLNSLVENILLAARMDERSFVLRREKIDLNAFIRQLIQKSNLFLPHQSKIKVDVTEGKTIEADPLALSSVLCNLIENAIKYGDQQEISIHLSNGELLVSDRGPGIPDTEKEKVFEKFYRIGNEETRNQKGTGLGLYLVKKLTEAHGWGLQVRDNRPKGCTFAIQFNEHVR